MEDEYREQISSALVEFVMSLPPTFYFQFQEKLALRIKGIEEQTLVDYQKFVNKGEE